MYELTLTRAERKAIDWIGGRYAHGDDLYKLLCKASWLPYDADWDDDRDMTFTIPEHVAWDIHDIAEECEYRWDCFAGELASKLTQFCEGVV